MPDHELDKSLVVFTKEMHSFWIYEVSHEIPRYAVNDLAGLKYVPCGYQISLMIAAVDEIQ